MALLKEHYDDAMQQAAHQFRKKKKKINVS
jgi:hypothetical protein